MGKVLYLDIDEVLHSLESRYFKRGIPQTIDIKHSAQYFDSQSVSLLQDVLNITQAKLVLCSSWRLSIKPEVLKYLETEIFLSKVERFTPSIATPYFGTVNSFRGVEVQYDIERYDVQTYVIVDDGSDFFEHQNLVQPTALTGFRLNHAIQCVNSLGVAEEFKEFQLARLAKTYRGFRESKPVLKQPPLGSFSFSEDYVFYVEGDVVKRLVVHF